MERPFQILEYLVKELAFMQLSQKETLKTAKTLEPNHTPNQIFFW